MAGKGLAAILKKLNDPEEIENMHPGEALHATLRPYQELGLRWLWLVSQLGLGAGCLADDMGLGKTIQVLALLLVLKQQGRSGPSSVGGPCVSLRKLAKRDGAAVYAKPARAHDPSLSANSETEPWKKAGEWAKPTLAHSPPMAG